MAAAGSVEITNRDEERGQLCHELPSVGSGCITAVNSNGNCRLNKQIFIWRVHPNRKPVFFLKKIGLSVKSLFAAKWHSEGAFLSLSFCKKIVRSLLVRPEAALLPRKPPGSGDEASVIFPVSL